jgi:hypothetical protein
MNQSCTVTKWDGSDLITSNEGSYDYNQLQLLLHFLLMGFVACNQQLIIGGEIYVIMLSLFIWGRVERSAVANVEFKIEMKVIRLYCGESISYIIISTSTTDN